MKKILDGCLVRKDQRTEVFDYFTVQLGYRVLFIECVCNDAKALEHNYQEVIRHSVDYAGMDPIMAAEDLRLKVSHYVRAYEPMDEINYPRITIDTVTMDIHAHKVSGHIESTILGYIGSVATKPHTIYFSRVSNVY